MGRKKYVCTDSRVYISLFLSKKKGEKGYWETPAGIIVESPNQWKPQTLWLVGLPWTAHSSPNSPYCGMTSYEHKDQLLQHPVIYPYVPWCLPPPQGPILTLHTKLSAKGICSEDSGSPATANPHFKTNARPGRVQAQRGEAVTLYLEGSNIWMVDVTPRNKSSGRLQSSWWWLGPGSCWKRGTKGPTGACQMKNQLATKLQETPLWWAPKGVLEVLC